MTQNVAVAVLFILGVRWLAHRLRRYSEPSAPSPPSDPLLGHLLRLPKKDLDLYLHELRSIYGDVFNIRIPGSNFLVLNSVKPAVDLLEGRSGIYNDRPSAPLAQLCEVGDTMFFMRPNEEFRLHRRVFNNYLSKSKLAAQGPEIFSLTQHHVLNAIRTIMTCKPEDIHDHFLVFATAVITELTFGHRLSRQPEDDPYFKLAYDVNFHGIPAVKPHGSELIDVFPILTKLPDWLPINKHVVNAKKAGMLFKRFTSFPYEDVQKKMEERNASPCILVSELEKLQDGSSTATPHQLQQIMTSFFLGGAGAVATTVSIMAAAFILYPETQARAQEEIERVVGSNRLPELSDRASLPYIEGVLEEVLRWKPSAPLGIPHLASEDDIYNGYSIPKGTIILSNITAMSLDESVYQDPTRFDPSRFLPQPEGRGEPIFHSAFGFGRRVCPGRYFATDTLWVAMATLISALTISRPLDSTGKEYTPEIEWEVHQTCHPSHFPCRITPRNPKILSTLESLAISDEGI